MIRFLPSIVTAMLLYLQSLARVSPQPIGQIEHTGGNQRDDRRCPDRIRRS